MSKKFKKLIVTLIVVLCMSLSMGIIFAQAESGITLTVSDPNPQNVAFNAPYVFPDVTVAEYVSDTETIDLSDQVTVCVEHGVDNVWSPITESASISEAARTYTPNVYHGYYRMAYTVSYNGVEKTVYSQMAIADTLTSIIVDTANVKTTYNIGEELDLSGLVVNMTRSYTTSPTALSDSEYSIDSSAFQKDTAGDYVIKVSCSKEYANVTITKTAEFTVSVLASGQTVEPTLALSLKSNISTPIPYGVAYTFPDAEAIYKDENGQASNVSASVKVLLMHMGSAAGTEWIAWPRDSVATDMSATTRTFTPDDHGYFKMVYTIEYNGLTQTIETEAVNVADTIEKIIVYTDTVDTTINQGEEINLDGLVVKKWMSYSSNWGSAGEIEVTDYSIDYSGYTTSSPAGDYTITVSYTETYGVTPVTKTATFIVTVQAEAQPIEPTLDIQVGEGSAQIGYGVPYIFPNATATYTDSTGQTHDVSANIKVLLQRSGDGVPDDQWADWPEGAEAVAMSEATRTATPDRHGRFRLSYTISYEGLEKVAYWQVAIADTLTKIDVDTTNVKTTYNIGEELDLSGLVVNMYKSYTTSAQAISAGSYKVDNGGFDKDVANEYTITVSYSETYGTTSPLTKTATFIVTVLAEDQTVEPTLTITGVPEKMVSDAEIAKAAHGLAYTFRVPTAIYSDDKGEQHDVTSSIKVQVFHGSSTGYMVFDWSTQITESLDYKDNKSFVPAHHGYYRVLYTITYEGLTATAEDIIEIQDTLVSIEVDTSKVFTTLNPDEDLDLSELVVKKSMSYSTIEKANPPVVLKSDAYSVDSSAFQKGVEGEYDITVSYTETYGGTKTVTFKVTVVSADTPIDREILTLTVNTDKQEVPIAYGLPFTYPTATAIYTASDGKTTSDVSSSIVVYAEHGVSTATGMTWTRVADSLFDLEKGTFTPDQHGFFRIVYTVTQGNKTQTAYFQTNIQDTLVSIEVDTSKVFTTLNPDEDLDLSELVVKKSMSYSTIETANPPVVLKSDAYSVDSSAFQKGVEGEYDIIVSYTETYGGTKTVTFKVTVVSAGTPVDRSYLELNVETDGKSEEKVAYGLPYTYPTATATYSPDSVTTSDVSSSIVVYAEHGISTATGMTWTKAEDSLFDLEKGTFTPNQHGFFRIVYTIEQGSKSQTAYFQINIQDTLASISVDTSNVDTVLEPGDKLDLTGLIVKKSMSYSTIVLNGTPVELDSTDYTVDISAFKENVAGVYEIVVSYSETYGGTRTAKFTVELKDKLKSVTFDSNPTKTTYAYGESFDFTGATVTATYVLQGEIVVAITDLSVEGYNANAIGNQQVKIVYGEYESEPFSVTVLDELYTILITTQNVKVEYKVGEEIDLTNLKVEKVMRSETKTEVAIADCTIDYDGYTKDSPAGTYTVTVSYTENGVTKTAGFDITVTGSQGGNGDNNTDKEEGGCGSYIGGSSIIVATLLMAAVVVSLCVTRKKA